MNSESCLTELELMEAAYSDKFEMLDAGDGRGVTFVVRLEHCGASLRYHVPRDYPDTPLKVSLEANMRNSDRANVAAELQAAIRENPEIGSMEICHMASASLANIVARDTAQEVNAVEELGEVRIARFLIYFHHIMSQKKRHAICEGAKVFSLGGFSKHGYPGVCVIEGHVDDVLEFVRQIQHLRWKQMTVRGEEIECCVVPGEVNAKAAGGCTSAQRKELICDVIDANRRLPSQFVELENMSDASSICTQCGLHDLFVTVMKNYSGGSAADK